MLIGTAVPSEWWMDLNVIVIVIVIVIGREAVSAEEDQ